MRPLGRGPNRYAQISNDLKFAIEYSNKMAGPLSELNRSVDILHGAGQAEGARGVRPGDRVYTAKLSQRAANKEIGRKKGDEEGYDKLNDAIDELNQTADSITNTVISVRTPLMFVKAGRGRIPEGVSRAMFDMAQAKADMMSAYGEAAAKGTGTMGRPPREGHRYIRCWHWLKEGSRCNNRDIPRAGVRGWEDSVSPPSRKGGEV